MPPRGLPVVAAAVPPGWEVRFIDENIRKAKGRDFCWADSVFVSGMHVQRRRINDISARAQRAGKPAVPGGPSVSSSPEAYPGSDYLHIGEMGDATRALFDRLGRDCARPANQRRFETRERPKQDNIPDVISIGILTRHRIAFARKAAAGKLNASNYSSKPS